MSQTHRAAGAAAPHARAAQRRHPADQLTGCVHVLEELVRDAETLLDRETYRAPHAALNDLEERAARLGAEIAGVFRRPTAKPLWIDSKGTGMLF